MPNSYLTRATLYNAVVVVSTDAGIESPVVDLKDAAQLPSVVLKASSVSGAADVKLEYVTSPDSTNFEDYADTVDITSSTNTDKPNNKEGFNPYFMPTAPENRYIKFKVTGVGSNPADTLVTCYMMLREGDI